MTAPAAPPPPGPGVVPAPLPGWLGSAVQVTTQVGVPTVFAGVLLWFVLTRVGGTLDHMQQADDDRVRIIAAMQDTLIAALNKQADRFESAIRENMAVNRQASRDLLDHLERYEHNDGPHK